MKRKRAEGVGASTSNPIDFTTGADSPPKKRKSKNESEETEERRLRFFRKYPPQTYLVKLERARTQRLFVLNRTRGGTEEVPEEHVDIAGTTGNIYRVVIGKEPSCTCPDSRKGNQCKHIVYVLYNVLKAQAYLQYQLAFLSSELRQMFQDAPMSPTATASTDNGEGNRKEIGGDCPICFMEFEPACEDIVWCKAACGNNIHKKCFEKWVASQRGKEIRCVYCRTPWQNDIPSTSLMREGKLNEEGYVNIGESLGLSGERDSSTYHQPWGYQRSYRSSSYYYY